ncbi:MAG: transglutaminase family protein [Planctomycetaceae bacterium]
MSTNESPDPLSVAMARRTGLFVVFSMTLFLAVATGTCVGADVANAPVAAQLPDKSVAELTELVRKSIVVVSFTGRDGRQAGIGTGFVVDPAGLIATNLHVIGEARPITVTMNDGRKFNVTEIHATERASDLAVLRIDAKDLSALPLGDSDSLKPGAEVVTVGNPRGLTFSVAAGVVSGRREIDGRSMIQLAIPIEQGNSGGPLLDRAGRVHGLLTLKSVVTENLGFAMPVNLLKPLLKKPNPVPMSRWLTVGTLNPKEWNPLLGASWRQRAGRIVVDGPGEGFGGRSICLSLKPVPPAPSEIGVDVRLNSEDGAAGIVFHADGKHAHYGFYPSNGRLRLSRFDGPDVTSWNVLQEVPSPHYRNGSWNRLKVRIETGKIRCFVNDEFVIESTDNGYSSGAAGLAKFRDTRAEFRNFEVAVQIPTRKPSDDVRKRIAKLVSEFDPAKPPKGKLLDQLLEDGAAGTAALREHADLLERQANHLNRLARDVHRRNVRRDLVAELGKPEEEINLMRAALLIAVHDNEEVEIDGYLREVENIAKEISDVIPANATDTQKLEALDKHLFSTLGFHGSRVDYYNKSNSYLNEVIDDREGLPITLSVLYLDVAQRIGLKLEGVGLPGHFVVRFAPKDGPEQIIDVFDGGTKLTRAKAIERVKETSDNTPTDDDWKPQSKRAIISRMLQNLLNAAGDANDVERMTSYAETLVELNPESIPERWYRAVLYFRTGRLDDAKIDADWLLERDESQLERIVDIEQVRALRRLIDEAPK